MGVGTWIAAYAALVATATAAWQAGAWWVDRRPRVRVSGYLTSLVSKLPPTFDRSHFVQTLPWYLQIEVLNFGRAPVRIGRVEVVARRSPDGSEVWTSMDWGLPWVLEPGQGQVVGLTDEEAGELKDGQKLLIRVVATTGPSFETTLLVGGKGDHLVVMPPDVFGAVADRSKAKFHLTQHAIFGTPEGEDDFERFLRRTDPASEEAAEGAQPKPPAEPA